jgi:hypothetical protein
MKELPSKQISNNIRNSATLRVRMEEASKDYPPGISSKRIGHTFTLTYIFAHVAIKITINFKSNSSSHTDLLHHQPEGQDNKFILNQKKKKKKTRKK